MICCRCQREIDVDGLVPYVIRPEVGGPGQLFCSITCERMDDDEFRKVHAMRVHRDRLVALVQKQCGVTVDEVRSMARELLQLRD